MTLDISIVLIPLGLTTALSAALAWHAWRRRTMPGAVPFTLLMLAAAEWSLAYLLQLASPDLGQKVFWLKMQTVGLALAAAIWVVFALRYAGRSRLANASVMALLSSVSAIFVVLVCLNDLLGWIWQDLQQRSFGSLSAVVMTPGPGYGFLMAVMALWLLLGTILLIHGILQSRGGHRAPFVLLVVTVLLPWVTNGLYHIGFRPLGEVDPTSVVASLSAVALSLGVFGFRMFDAVPVARSALLERMTDGVIVLGPKDRVLELNQAAANMLGCPAAMAVGRSVEEVLPSGVDLSSLREQDQVLQGTFRLGEGEDLRQYDLRALPQYDPRGVLTGRLVLLHDITAEKQTENTLGELSRAIEQIPDIVIITDVEGNIEYVNPKFFEVTGYRREEVVGKTARFLKSGIVPEDIYKQLWDTIGSGGEWRGELQDRKKDGTPYWVSASISATKGPEGRIQHYVAVQEDITARKYIEAENRRRAVQQEALTEVIAHAVGSSDLKGLIEHSLDHTLQALGLRHGGIIVAGLVAVRDQSESMLHEVCHSMAGAGTDLSRVMLVSDWYEVKDRDPLAMLAWQAMGHGYRASAFVPLVSEGRLLGALCMHALSPKRWEPEEVALMQAIASQLGVAAERLGLLHKTQQQARQLQRIMDTVRSGIASLDGSGRVVMANAAAREYLKLLAGIQVGDTLVSLDGKKLSELLEPRADMLPHVIDVEGPPKRVFEVYANHGSATEELDGCTLLIRDVTESWQARERAQSQDRLAVVGQLAAGIAHDFNNFLGTIILYTELLLEEPRCNPKMHEQLGTILQQARRASTLTRQILDFSRRSVMERNPLDLFVFLKEFETLMRRTMPENIGFYFNWDSEASMVEADPAHLQQVFMNLAINAQDVMPEGGELRFEVRSETIEPGETTPLDMPPGNWIQVRVSDTGSGIPPDVLPRIFEPFFTTKTPGVGTGLGLAQVYGIVKQHDGFIDVESVVGEGTTFTIYFPALVMEQTQGIEVGSRPLDEGKGETILVVEDDHTGRDALADVLESLHYKVVLAKDGADALEKLKECGGEVDVVLCDMVMPRMGGIELCRVLRQDYPELKVILMSGYPLVGGTRELLDVSGVTRIQKPVSLKALSRAVRTVEE